MRSIWQVSRSVLCASTIAVAMSACGGYGDSYVVNVDSLEVVTTTVGATTVRASGFASNGCSVLSSVERWQRGDSMVRRVYAKDRRLNCTQMPIRVFHEETLVNAPPRSVSYVFLQRDGSAYTRVITLPPR
jgi:hypothetical protein